MMKAKKILSILLLSLGMALSSCGGASSVSIDTDKDEQIHEIYLLAQGAGETKSYEEWLKTIKGADGHTPVVSIGENGNWYIDGVDTGYQAVGKDGQPGEKGEQGNPGKDGEQGPQGEKGDQGEQGIQGPQGEQGIQGNDGHSPVITIGENGNWYIDGVDTGLPSKGEKGDQGEQGIQGPQGEQGIQGNTGDQGPQGEKGDQGIQGDQGEKGEDGTSIRTGYGEPQGWAQDGDCYIDLSTWNFYVRESSTWLIKGNIKGESGKDYERATHTVHFDSKGGTEVNDQRVVHGEKVSKPTDPVKEGCVFDGWYDSYGEKWSFGGHVVTEEMTLVAHYQKNIVNNGEYKYKQFDYLDDVTEGKIYISDVYEMNGVLKYAIDNPDKNYKFMDWTILLTNDIDYKSEVFPVSGKRFDYFNIEGNGHAIKNIEMNDDYLWHTFNGEELNKYVFNFLCFGKLKDLTLDLSMDVNCEGFTFQDIDIQLFGVVQINNCDITFNLNFLDERDGNGALNYKFAESCEIYDSDITHNFDVKVLDQDQIGFEIMHETNGKNNHFLGDCQFESMANYWNRLHFNPVKFGNKKEVSNIVSSMNVTVKNMQQVELGGLGYAGYSSQSGDEPFYLKESTFDGKISYIVDKKLSFIMATIGGIGYAINPSIKDCTFSGEIDIDVVDYKDATSDSFVFVGGICGDCSVGSYIEGCVNEGTIHITSDCDKFNMVPGGIVGHVVDARPLESTENTARIINCEMKGTIDFSGFSTSIGGIVGELIRQINSSEYTSPDYEGCYVSGCSYNGTMTLNYPTGNAGYECCIGAIAGQIVGSEVSKCKSAGTINISGLADNLKYVAAIGCVFDSYGFKSIISDLETAITVDDLLNALEYAKSAQEERGKTNWGYDSSFDLGINLYRTLLNGDEKAFYDDLVTAADELLFAEYVPTSAYGIQADYGKYGISADRAVDIFFYVIFDNPQYYWLTSYYYTDEDNGILTAAIDYYHAYLSYSFRELMKSRLDEGKEIIDSNLGENPSDYKKIVTIYQYVIELLHYDYDYYNSGKYITDKHTITDALLTGATVCQGYTLLFELYCDYYGINCASVTSDTMNHIWNIVEIDSTWYYVDATWEDPNTTDGYHYLLVGSVQFGNDHNVCDQITIIPTISTSNYQLA